MLLGILKLLFISTTCLADHCYPNKLLGSEKPIDKLRK